MFISLLNNFLFLRHLFFLKKSNAIKTVISTVRTKMLLTVRDLDTSKFKSIESRNQNHFSENNTSIDRVCLAQLVRFLVVKLIHSSSNPIFDMCVVFMANYSFSGR
jgi:hypothetical protein